MLCSFSSVQSTWVRISAYLWSTREFVRPSNLETSGFKRQCIMPSESYFICEIEKKPSNAGIGVESQTGKFWNLRCLFFCSVLQDLAASVKPLVTTAFSISTPSSKAESIWWRPQTYVIINIFSGFSSIFRNRRSLWRCFWF